MPDQVRSSPGEPRSELPARVTMPLLTLITQQAVDEDYLHAAERRKAGLSGPRAGRPWVTAAVVIAVFGVLVSTAAVQTSRQADINDASRTTLITRIENQRERVARQQDRIAELRARNSRASAELTALTEAGEAAEARLGRLRVTTGFVAVTGEGVRVIVDDAETGDPNGIVRDSDLALLVNALWSSGAEAIGINGQRVTVMTGIRLSGSAIEVNSVGIAPPYTVLAIGDRGSLQANFYNTSSGLAFDNLTRSVDIPYEMENVEQISLPSGPTRYLQLRAAQAGVGDDRHEPAPGEEPE
jgi:uncharacterized protein YlxW (UPF0749 family)